MARLSNSELERRLSELEAENAALRAQVGSDTEVLPVDAAAAPAVRKRRSWGWTLLATVLIVLGAILAPLAVVASWAKVQLTDTDSFVATYAPLAHDPGVQSFVTDQAVKAVQDNVDIPQVTSQVIDGITGLGTGPVATKALESLKGPLAQGIVSLMRSTVQRFVASDAFAQVWQQALRTSHEQLIATMQNNPKAAIAVGADGSVGIQLAPIIDRVKQLLIDQGLTFASRIPTVDRTVTIAQNSSIPTLQVVYGLALAAGAWLPWVALGLLALGVLVARRRAVALVWAAVALGLGMAVVLGAIGIGRVVFVASASPSLIPSGLARTLFTTVTTAMIDTAVAVLVLAVVVALVAWYSGPFAVPRRLRGFFGSGVAWVRESAERHGITTGRAGVWMYTQRTLLRAIVAAIAAAVVLFVRPLTPSLIIWTLVLAALAVAILELVQRPAVTVPESADDETPVVTVS
ncbi:bZIP transcription factor [Leifsonia sp. fls2-241-R2A-40a]|uniref:bZIP transcription factor n=1 Tax=Leifsonia sp. fls2-241-R2A-40a TaxID=3040290 RepID=UPI00254E0443|nr:bZIP transcription factor [Leifsonia sp. fls2-241-R2A-40a]